MLRIIALLSLLLALSSCMRVRCQDAEGTVVYECKAGSISNGMIECYDNGTTYQPAYNYHSCTVGGQ